MWPFKCDAFKLRAMKKRSFQIRIGEAIRKRREGGPRNQEEFADHIEMHRAYYGEIERGKKDIRMTTLLRVCEGLNCPVWEVIREAESAE